MSTKDTVTAFLVVNHTGLGRAGDVVEMLRTQFDGNSKLGLCRPAGEPPTLETAEAEDAEFETADLGKPQRKPRTAKKPS